MARIRKIRYPGDERSSALSSGVFISRPRKLLNPWMMKSTSLTCPRISQILQKRCTFPYSPYIESLGILLATEPEYSSDRYLLHIVQLQKISERIVLFSTPVVPEIHDPNLGIEHYYRELKMELARYQANLPFPLTENRALCETNHLILTQSNVGIQMFFSCNSMPSSCTYVKSHSSTTSQLHRTNDMARGFRLRY